MQFPAMKVCFMKLFYVPVKEDIALRENSPHRVLNVPYALLCKLEFICIILRFHYNKNLIASINFIDYLLIMDFDNRRL